MHCIITWCNNNQGFLMVVITAIYVIATIFICIFNGKSANAANKQIVETSKAQEKEMKIQLAEKRIELISNFDKQINFILDNWECDKIKELFDFKLKNELMIYFDNSFLSFFKNLDNKINKINLLIGDYEHAERRGECRGRGLDDIKIEIEQEKKDIVERYKTLKEESIEKYLMF